MRILLALCLSFTAALATEPPSALELAKYLDTVRRPERSFELHMTLTEWRDGKKDRTSEFHVLARKDGQGFDTLTRCLAPAEDANKVLLARDRELWLFDPKSSRPTRIPPQRLRAKAWDIDVLSASFASDYESEFLGEETVADAAKAQRACYHLKLTLRDKSNATAPVIIEYWLDRANRHPVEGRFYNASGKLLRTVRYAGFREALGVSRPGRAFVTGSESGVVEELRFTDTAYRDLPERLFTNEALPAISRGEAP